MTTTEFLNSDIAKKLANYKLPRYEELPKYPVIMSQLLEILDDCLSIFEVPGEEKLLTQAMINSYVKTKILAPPQSKRYTKNHIIHLISLALLKQVLNISDVGKFIKVQIEQYPIEVAYNFFCNEIEDALKVTFGTRRLLEFTNAPSKSNVLTECVHSAVIAFANKIFVKHCLFFEDNKKK